MQWLIVLAKRICLLCIVYHTIIFNGFAQTIVGKVLTNRQLTWLDFEGKADPASPYSASTYWSVNYRSHLDSCHADTAFVSFRVVPVFNNYLSWVKRESIKKRKVSVNLLFHEQGHYNMAVACAESLRKALQQTLFLQSNYVAKADSIADAVTAYFTAIEDQYDTETNHMLNQDEQKKWNQTIATLLVKDSASVLTKNESGNHK